MDLVGILQNDFAFIYILKILQNKFHLSFCLIHYIFNSLFLRKSICLNSEDAMTERHVVYRPPWSKAIAILKAFLNDLVDQLPIANCTGSLCLLFSASN